MAVIAVLACSTGCEREPLEVPCTDVAAGDLVVSELHAEWIELYNASAGPIDLAGIVIDLQNLMGGDPDRIVVRVSGVTIGAQDYAVLGRFGVAFVDYAYTLDFDDDLYDNGRMRVEVCGLVVDEIVYWGLPDTGTAAFDGALDPDATANDNADVNDSESDWCIDDTDENGTPGERNRTCD